MLLYNWNLKPMTCCGECEIYNIILLSYSSRVVRFTEMYILITDLEVLFAGWRSFSQLCSLYDCWPRFGVWALPQ